MDVELEQQFEVKWFSEKDKVFHQIFIATIESNNETIIHQEEEVDSVEWIPAEKIKNELKEEPDKYSPLYQVGMKIYFDQFHEKQ